jgi:SAM-dependent methyltransferase
VSSQNSDSLRTAYDLQADRRDRGGIDEWKVVERGAFLSLMQREGKRNLLEIGSGPGRDGQFFQEAGLKVTCIDLSPEMVRLCRQKNLNALVMDMTELTFPDDSFDSVYALNSLLHLAKSELPSVLQQINRVLAPGGVFFMGVYGGQDFEGIRADDPNVPKRFFSFFTDEHLRSVVSDVFEVLSFRSVALPREDSEHFQALVLRKHKPGP